MNKEKLENIVKRLNMVKSECEQIMSNDLTLKYVCIIADKVLTESAKSMANTIVNGMVEFWPNHYPNGFKLESYLPPLKKVDDILSFKTLNNFVKLDDGRRIEIDERISKEEFKEELLKLIETC